MVRTVVGAAVVGAAVVALTLAGCGGGTPPADGPGDDRPPQILRVPTAYPTIQAAVDAAEPGDMVLVAAGTYRESVIVETDRLVVRGEDRGAVVLDGGDELQTGVAVYGRRVAVEHLTVRDYQVNGVLVAGDYRDGGEGGEPMGFRISHVTAVRNGLYGIYAFGARGGTIEHSSASGSPDSGIYVGQCDPCEIVVRGNVAERNAIGYQATNASGVDVVGNVWRANRVGMTVSSGAEEDAAPQQSGNVVGNLVEGNAERSAPGAREGFGVGIVIGGGRDNLVARNRVRGHPVAGVLLVDQDGFAPSGNRVEANVLHGNAVDVMAAWTGRPFERAGSCLAANTTGGEGVVVTSPSGLAAAWPCDGPGTELAVPALGIPAAPPPADHRAVPDPPAQPAWPTDPEEWAAPPSRPPAVDLDAVRVPEG